MGNSLVYCSSARRCLGRQRGIVRGNDEICSLWIFISCNHMKSNHFIFAITYRTLGHTRIHYILCMCIEEKVIIWRQGFTIEVKTGFTEVTKDAYQYVTYEEPLTHPSWEKAVSHLEQKSLFPMVAENCHNNKASSSCSTFKDIYQALQISSNNYCNLNKTL